MKRLYYLLLAACALFVLPQAAKADLEVKLIGGYTGTWNNWTDAFTSKGNNTYTLDFTSEKDGDYYFRVAVTGWSQINPTTKDFELTSVSSYEITGDCYGRDLAFKVSMTKGKTYTFTFTGSNDASVARTVSCVEKSGGGSTDTDKEKVYLTGNYANEDWVTSDAFTAQGNNIYTYEYTSTKAGEYWFKFKVDGWTNDPCPKVNGYELTSESYSFVYSNDYPNCAFKVTMEAGKTYVFTFASVAKTVSCALKSGGGDTPTPTPTVTKEYTEGYYLVGNFFNTDGTTINYDNGVFKFRQTSDDENGNARYMVEIPASLTAHAQVMAVGKNGKATGVYGPGSAYGVSYTNPATAGTISGTPTFSETVAEGTNYWNMVTRNETPTNYSDGTYEITLTETIDADGAKITKWEIKHNDKKRVAYLLSDANNAVALPLYDAFKKDDPTQFANRFYATVNLSANNSYYVVSNYLNKPEYVDKASDYNAVKAEKYIGSPTANKLFLLGNGGHEFGQKPYNEFSPNEKPMLVTGSTGTRIVEYNPSNGDDAAANTTEHLGIRGQFILRDTRDVINSVSIVGTLIPASIKSDGTWDYTSTAGDMTWDGTENCYKLTLVSNGQDGELKFRFVGNHNKSINWHEDGTEDEKKAKSPYNDPNKSGHVANAADPNPVHYTQTNENEDDEDYHIVWNRPAGRYTVRLYTKTTTDGNDPVTVDYYTITANTDLELRDFEDVVYKSLDNKRIIKNRGDYRYFRTWSARRTMKRPESVDVFVVESVSNSTDGNTVTFSLKNINNWNGTDDVIPANTGVILAVKKGNEPTNSQVRTRESLTSYNTLVVPAEMYAEVGKEELAYNGTNLLKTSITAQTIPTYNSEKDEYNYLFGFYQANRGLGVDTYKANVFLLGFWISSGSGAFYSNSAYLPVKSDVAEKMNLGVSYNDFDPTTGAKKVPALLFDFESLGDGGNGEITGIKNVEPAANEIMDNNYYTLGGQRIGKPLSRGIYIHNGKKYIIK